MSGFGNPDIGEKSSYQGKRQRSNSGTKAKEEGARYKLQNKLLKWYK